MSATATVSLKNQAQGRFTSGPALVLYIAAAKLLLHVFTAFRYNLFRDEMYYLACARHMAWGYVDHPPFTPFIGWIELHLFGSSALAVRILPALAGAALVWLTGKMAREMGGGRFAQAFAALAVVFVPIYLVAHHWLTDNVFEHIIWMGCVYLVIRAINTGDARCWFWFGALAGVGFENKYSIAFLLLGLLVGVLLTPERRFLKSKYLWLGVLACAVISLPNLIWEVRNQYPFLELIHNIRMSNRDVIRGPVAFIADQAMIMNPVLFPLWVGGVIWLLFTREGKRYRVLGWAFIVVLTSFIVLKGKNYYVTPVYPMLFAAGAVALERITAARRAAMWGRGIYATLVIVASLLLMPYSVPLLSPENFIRYEKALGLTPPEFEHQENGPLPQWFADEFGWDYMVQEVARVYNSLPPEERARTAIFSNGWGEAAAVDYYGPKYGLPPAISKHNNYWIWGPRNYDGSTMIILRSGGRNEPQLFQSVQDMGALNHPYARRDEWFHILLCRGLKVDLHDAWPQLKVWD
jgi:dolichyl-phosphate-mannose-protein mannosyltransferase